MAASTRRTGRAGGTPAKTAQAQDALDVILDQWASARPDLDASPMAVLGRLSRITRITERRQHEVYDEFGLQRGEFDLLATLRRAAPPEGMTAGALAESAMVTSGAITHRLDRLVGKGYVTREIDPANRRTVLVALTTAGRTLIDQALGAHVDNERRILESLSAAQQRDLASLLRSLAIGLADQLP